MWNGHSTSSWCWKSHVDGIMQMTYVKKTSSSSHLQKHLTSTEFQTTITVNSVDVSLDSRLLVFMALLGIHAYNVSIIEKTNIIQKHCTPKIRFMLKYRIQFRMIGTNSSHEPINSRNIHCVATQNLMYSCPPCVCIWHH